MPEMFGWIWRRWHTSDSYDNEQASKQYDPWMVCRYANIERDGPDKPSRDGISVNDCARSKSGNAHDNFARPSRVHKMRGDGVAL